MWKYSPLLPFLKVLAWEEKLPPPSADLLVYLCCEHTMLQGQIHFSGAGPGGGGLEWNMWGVCRQMKSQVWEQEHASERQSVCVLLYIIPPDRKRGGGERREKKYFRWGSILLAERCQELVSANTNDSSHKQQQQKRRKENASALCFNIKNFYVSTNPGLETFMHCVKSADTPLTFNTARARTQVPTTVDSPFFFFLLLLEKTKDLWPS